MPSILLNQIKHGGRCAIDWNNSTAAQPLRGSLRFSIRDCSVYQIWWICGKLPNGLWPPSPPPPYFRKTMLRFLQRNFSGCSDPTLFLYRKSATKFFGSEMTPPPLRKFSENSSNLVQVVFPNASGAFWWPNLLLMQVAPTDGQICY